MQRKFTDQIEEEMARLYQSNPQKSIRVIAKLYQCSYAVVRGILLRRKVQLRDADSAKLFVHGSRPFTAEEESQIVADYLASPLNSILVLSRKYNCHPNRIRRLLHLRGVPRRSNAEIIPHKTGPLASRWKGGMTRGGNRIFVYCPSHPLADSRGYVRRSVLAAEKSLGRQLCEGEIVHHINGNTLDDRPENLKVFENTSAHLRVHWLEGDTFMHRKTTIICCICKQSLPLHAKKMCKRCYSRLQQRKRLQIQPEHYRVL